MSELSNARDLFRTDVLGGLDQPQKTLPCRWLYDEAGSVLFEQITEQPEYYPTRTEIGILKTNAQQIITEIGTGAALIEYGAGASAKTRILLDNIEQLAGYVPIDISDDFLLQIAKGLRKDYPDLAITPVAADFLGGLDRFDLPVPENATRIGFFSGSTLGNFDDDEIERFLGEARATLGDAAHFLLSVDLCRTPEILLPAYNDSQAVTARFNLNILTRINRELDGNFNSDRFAHKAIWNEIACRIEMHLISDRQQTVTIAGKQFAFEPGETIHTENSCKFAMEDLQPVFAKTGWGLHRQWSDPDHLYAVLMLSAQ